MSVFTNQTGLQILEFINSIKINYGKNNLAKMIQNEFNEFSLYQAKNILSQLIEKGFLKEMNVGMSFAMIVLALTDKGKSAVMNKETIALDFQSFCTTTFKSATDLGVVDKDTIEEYYNIKKELIELQRKEEELKDSIKITMIEKNASEIHSELMDLYCKKIERIMYPKEKIERFVPNYLLEKIRTVNESIILTTRLKIKKIRYSELSSG